MSAVTADQDSVTDGQRDNAEVIPYVRVKACLCRLLSHDKDKVNKIQPSLTIQGHIVHLICTLLIT